MIATTAALLLAAASAQAAKPPAHIAAAVADPGRPAGDVYRDDRRKPAETVAFAGVEPGMSIAELIPGNGYYTRILSKAVGPKGHVYTVPFSEPRASYSKAIAADPAYANVTLIGGAPLSIGVPAPVDLVWTSQNYHDIRQGRALLNKAVFAALKPGGTYFIVDHSAVAGAGQDVLLSLHRIDVDVVKREVLAAGFVLEAESDLLRNPADKRTQMVFDREVNRDTDQFVLKFRKPAK
ncbi:MAG: class I SAM-dependent methyltransferase [Phenylobacterium sp.]